MDIARVVGWNDLDETAAKLMLLEKHPVNAMQYEWPKPGEHIRMELISWEMKKVRFYLDIFEGKRKSRVALSIAPDRKVTMRCRGEKVLVRADVSTIPEILRHHNPDHGMVVGNHIHLDIDGTGDRWAFPLNGQSVVPVTDSPFPGLPVELLGAIEEACHIAGSNLKTGFPLV